MFRRFLAVTLLASAALSAQTPPPPAKRLPPAGVAIPAAARTELMAATAALRRDLDALPHDLAAAGRSAFAAYLPDAEILHKAVDWSLRYDEFFDAKHVDVARRLLQTGHARAAELRAGTTSWTSATGTVIRGYRSQLDDSIQPYALHVPAEWQAGETTARRLDVVLLGRGEKRTELGFIVERERPARENDLVPPGALVLTPYGRFCNATKFAGETDVFEALAAVRAAYRIDPDRIIVRGFSMGGASTWHLAVHHPHLWAAASPGAGFAETPTYAKVFAPGKPARPPWEQTLWRWYNATGYAANLFNLPVVAYSGEIDPQKQAADIMADAMAAEGLKLEHLIGPKTAHKYHPETKLELARRLDALAARGRDPQPREVRFTTYTLRYPESHWVRIEGLEKHWERTDVVARLADGGATVTTRNVAALRLALPADATAVTIDGQRVPLPSSARGRATLQRTGGTWRFGAPAETLRKRPGLTGPINDAFLGRFLFVRPTGPALNPTLARWTAGELAHATKMWRDIFRGDALVKDDAAVTDADLAAHHLILWGDPASNRLLARLLATGKLPLTWDAGKLTFRGQTHDAAHHAPVLIFPNPLNPDRYVVLNSGIDFRDEAYGTNSLQTPKLPDYAIVDLREAPGPRWPGKIVTAGFFDEQWK